MGNPGMRQELTALDGDTFREFVDAGVRCVELNVDAIVEGSGTSMGDWRIVNDEIPSGTSTWKTK